jgi:hypothetical protein
MSKYSYYEASDRRVYNGAMCDDMQRAHNSVEKLKALLPEKHLLTYFPLEGKWCCSLKDFRGQMYYQIGWRHSLGDCLVEALEAIDVMEEGL